MNKPNPLAKFQAKKNSEAASSDVVPKMPVAKGRAANEDDGPQVVISFRASEAWRDDLAEYAASFRPKKKQQEILIEAVALHRAKHGKA